MNLSTFNPFSDKKKVKVFGERNSGTVYLEWLVQSNFKIDFQDYYTLGWKHRLAPNIDELTEDQKENILFLFIIKNPYSWLLSLHRKPYHHDELKKLSFTEFLQFPYGDYTSPIDMWNKKTLSYLKLASEVNSAQIIRYEDLLAHPQNELETLGKTFDLIESFSWFTDMPNTISNNRGVTSKSFHKDYYLKDKWKKALKNEHLSIIAKNIDTQLMEHFHYELIESVAKSASHA